MNQVSKLKPIQTIHLAFCGAVLLFAMVATLMVKDRIHFDASFPQSEPFYPLFPILAIIAIFTGVVLFNKTITGIPEGENLAAKLVKYQVAFLIRSAFLEGAALMNTVAFLVTANAVFLIAAALPFLVLIKFRPTKDSVTEALNLQYPDTDEL